MQNMIPHFLYILSIGVIISGLHGHLCYGALHRNTRASRSRLGKLITGAKGFNEESTTFSDEEKPDMTPHFEDTYDFIVIGAGTAGATIAARLSEIRKVKVLLIEAGSHETFFMDIPFIALTLDLIYHNINWHYQTKSSNNYCRGMKNNHCHWPSGKVVGGSSVLNFMVASRGNPEDYDGWAEMGNEGWAYKDVLKYFKKLETIDIPELKSDTTYHGTDGPVHINYPVFHTPLARAYLDAAKELGYPILDYNGKNQIGFSYTQVTQINGTRMSSNRAYLHPVHDRRNLHLTYKSTVTKVLIDHVTKRTIGVEFVKNDLTIRVLANKEVIVCAGAIASPQILMISGIGPTKQLKKLDIEVIQHAPVGENLQDHVGYYGLTFRVNAPVSILPADALNPSNHYITEFLRNRDGPLTVVGFESIGFVDTNDPKKRSGAPDIELLFVGTTLKDMFTPRSYNLNTDLRRQWNKHVNDYGWTLIPLLLQPKSRGRINLLSNDINVKPEIIPNYYDHPEDVETMIAGIRAALKIGRTRAMQAFNSQLLNITYPECNYYKYDSDDFWECAMRTIGMTFHHQSGTCKMGPPGDSTAVVDPRLKVIGIQGLRVADASIMPQIVSGHTNVPIHMIAEKAADMIKEDWDLEKL